MLRGTIVANKEDKEHLESLGIIVGVYMDAHRQLQDHGRLFAVARRTERRSACADVRAVPGSEEDCGLPRYV